MAWEDVLVGVKRVLRTDTCMEIEGLISIDYISFERVEIQSDSRVLPVRLLMDSAIGHASEGPDRFSLILRVTFVFEEIKICRKVHIDVVELVCMHPIR